MLFSSRKSRLGIDIGTSAIKVAEVKEEDGQYFLQNYGLVDVGDKFAKKESFNAIEETAEIINELLKRTGTESKKAVASLPNNAVFVTTIDLPKMSEKELKSAVEYEARRYVPLPLEEVTTSWSVMAKSEETGKSKVLLTAVPKSIIDNYVKIFKKIGLKPQALEIEALALIRSLIRDKSKTVILIDIGGRSTSLNLVSKGYLRVSRNVSVGGQTITKNVAESLDISQARAEQFKRDLGLTEELAQQIPQAMRPVVDRIKNETAQLIKIYESDKATVDKIIFAGSGAKLPGLVKYFDDLGPEVSLGDPLEIISYNKSAEENLKKHSLSLSVALGLAIREK